MPLEPTTNPTEDLVPPSPVSSKSPTDEAILALAQGIANEHKTKLSGATAIEELEYVLEQLDVHEPADPEYELWQYLNGRSTDTKAAALALAQYVGGGGGSSTQTLTVTKSEAGDIVSVRTVSWADYIARNYDAAVEVQPDSTDGLVSVYSIPVGTVFNVFINDSNANTFLDAEMTRNVPMIAMPSTPLYATNVK